MQQDNGANNILQLCGKIVSPKTFEYEAYGEKFYTFNVETKRLSSFCDTLPVTISERLIDDTIKPGSHILINGQLRSYNNYLDKRNKLILTVFAKDITPYEEENGANPNEITLNGYICKAPVFRTTPFGREIADILLAVNRYYNKSDYIPCIAWGRNAKYGAKLVVGDNIKIIGRLQSRAYQKKLTDGTVLDKTAYEVSIAKLELVED